MILVKKKSKILEPVATYVHCYQIPARYKIRRCLGATVLSLEIGRIRLAIEHFDAGLATVVNVEIGKSNLYLLAEWCLNSEKEFSFCLTGKQKQRFR